MLQALNTYKEFAQDCLGMDLSEDAHLQAAILQMNTGHATIFEASVVKGRSLGGMTRIKSFQTYLQEFGASKTPVSFVHATLLAYGKDAAK